MEGGSRLLFITLKEYSVMAMLSMCTASWTCWGGVFPPQRSGGCLFAVQFALLFSPSPVLSFPLIFFSWDFLVVVLKRENVLLCACPLRPFFFCHLIFFPSSLPPVNLFSYFPLTSSSSEVFGSSAGHRLQQLVVISCRLVSNKVWNRQPKK